MAGSSGFLFQEASQSWGLYYDGTAKQLQFVKDVAGARQAMALVDLATGSFRTEGSLEAQGNVTARGQLRAMAAGGQLATLAHDGSDATLATGAGDLLLAPASRLVRLDQDLEVYRSVTVGGILQQTVLHDDRLALPQDASIGPAGGELLLEGVGDSDALRKVRVTSKLFVDGTLEAGDTARFRAAPGATEAGGRLELAGVDAAKGDVLLGNHNGDLSLTTRAGATRTVRISGQGDGVANLDVEGTGTFGNLALKAGGTFGDLTLKDGAKLVVLGAGAALPGRIGVGTATPEQQLHLYSTSGTSGLRLEAETVAGRGRWEIQTREDGGLYLYDTLAGPGPVLGQTRMKIDKLGTSSLYGPLSMGSQPISGVRYLELQGPGGRDRGMLWSGTGANPSAIYVAGHKDGRDTTDGPLWFNSDAGFVWANGYDALDTSYLMSLGNGGVLHLPLALGVGTASAPSHRLHVQQQDGTGRVDLLRLENPGNNNFEIVSFGDGYLPRPGWIQLGGWNQDVHLALVADSRAAFQAGTSQQGIFLRGDTGHVGIGTDAPGARLTVRKTVADGAYEDLL
ncbi:MAG: hypothetical protein FJ125_16315, partial [Deltaproteobacteria bacterium]|nr:hypothetical protein [Deltaproteobacteria bacterium]